MKTLHLQVIDTKCGVSRCRGPIMLPEVILESGRSSDILGACSSLVFVF